MNANLIQTIDTKYKNGLVQCQCGWGKELGDGFNQYHIDKCPNCSKEITTRIQHELIVGSPKHYIIKYGEFVYFIINNCIHVQYSSNVINQSYSRHLPH